eukprot:3388122-Amphidinium_carterae.1
MADMLICTSPFIICAVLQSLIGLPSILYLGLPILWKMPTDHFHHPDARSEFWSLAARVVHSDSVVLAVNNPLLAQQISFQTPGAEPWGVRPHAVFTKATYVPVRSGEVLAVSRTKFLWVTFGAILKRMSPKDYP